MQRRATIGTVSKTYLGGGKNPNTVYWWANGGGGEARRERGNRCRGPAVRRGFYETRRISVIG